MTCASRAAALSTWFAALLVGCGDSASPSVAGDATGGSVAATGGSGSLGGTSTSGAASGGAAGASATGGTRPASGGSAPAGASAVTGGVSGGGADTGGRDAGGSNTSGVGAGGSATGGRTAGGSASGGRGSATGGRGTAAGGSVTGGSPGTGGITTGATGGSATGGSGTAGSATGGAGGGGCTGHSGLWVDGRFLRDRCCEKVVLRGVSEMVVWSENQDGTPYFSEIAKTGANVVRIAWDTTGSVAKLDLAVKNANDNKLIAMPELHDATGDFSALGSCIDYWVRSDVVAVLNEYEDKLLVNIANEVGDDKVSESSFTASYKDAVGRMRSAGIHVPLVIDASSWGQDIDMLQAAGPGLIDADPDHNLLLSVHMWWNDPNGTRVTTELHQSVDMNLPLIVGEFAQHAFSGCTSAPFAYKTLLSLSKTLEIGWLAWSWGGVKNADCADDGPFDMTSNGTYDGLTGWGLEVARTDPNSIQNTAVRPGSITGTGCP